MSAIETKERPILFSGEMVRAILDGRKTQTRRIVKPQPPSHVREIRVGMFEPVVIRKGMEEPGTPVFGFADEERGWKCKYGKPGDRLWVRETWFCITGEPGPISCNYKADFGEHRFAGFWKPSIHMPRWASRITLEITGVRVERLNDISEEDAIAEGCQCSGVPSSLTNRGAYAKLWESINGKGSWSLNPWVWVVEFKRVIAY